MSLKILLITDEPSPRDPSGQAAREASFPELAEQDREQSQAQSAEAAPPPDTRQQQALDELSVAEAMMGLAKIAFHWQSVCQNYWSARQSYEHAVSLLDEPGINRVADKTLRNRLRALKEWLDTMAGHVALSVPPGLDEE